MSDQPSSANAKLRLTYLGTNCLHLQDGETRLLIDPFFTRPSLFALLRRVAPNPSIIQNCLERANISRLDTVLLSHTHYDHALDAVLTARLTGALLVGSASASRLAAGGGLPVESCLRAEDGRSLSFGAFRITFFQHPHLSLNGLGWLAGGNIEKPLLPPVPAWQYRQGEVFTILCQHPAGNLLVVGSAGEIDPRKLKNISAGVVCLGIGGLAFRSAAYRREYFRTVAVGCGAEQVYLTHWDIFWKRLDRKPSYLPLHRLVERQYAKLAEKEGIRLVCLRPWQELGL